MKRVVSLLCVIFILVMISPTITFASPTNKQTNSNSSVYDTLTEKQKNILKSYGVTDNAMKNITMDEIIRLVNDDIILYPEYLESYYGTIDDAKGYISDVEDALNIPGISPEYADYLMSQGYSPDEIKQRANDNTLPKLISGMRPLAFDLTLFRKFIASTIGAIESVTYVYFANSSINTPFHSTATTEDVSVMATNVNRAITIGGQLYNGSIASSQAAYNLFGELDITSQITHEGSDYAKSEGSTVYSLTDGGVVTSIIDYRGGKVVVINHDEEDIAFMYLHVKNVNVSVGQTVNEGQAIAQQGKYIYGNVTNTHCHIEARDSASSIPTNGNSGAYTDVKSRNPYSWAEWL